MENKIVSLLNLLAFYSDSVTDRTEIGFIYLTTSSTQCWFVFFSVPQTLSLALKTAIIH